MSSSVVSIFRCSDCGNELSVRKGIEINYYDQIVYSVIPCSVCHKEYHKLKDSLKQMLEVLQPVTKDEDVI
jgi:hypothetical protein